MGNEASRGLSPGLPPSPLTPTGAVRRTKSFSHDASSSVPSPLDRSIQRMDKTIRKRVRGGVTYNMKIVLRGDRGTGKTSLFQRLRGEPIPLDHEPTPQLQSATINWSFRANSEESVKCDVWDVVDKGFVQAEANPFESTTGTHLVATVDATTVDVYHETHGVVFLLDVTKPHTLEYVRQHLDQVPVHIPTLVLGNFRDLGAQRKIFKEDIQELLYGGGAVQHQPVRRPNELLYFECSLFNCYGLKSLHQYFGIPFLQLKQNTIRQQLRILEGEFTHLKHDLQAKIAEQKYANYLEHIRATGSDIRTGRRAAASTTSVPGGPGANSTASSADEATVAMSNGDHTVDEDSPTSKTRLDRTLSSSSDIVVHGNAAATLTVESPVKSTPPPLRQVDLEDLPERTAALEQAGNSLKIEYTDEERQAAKRPSQMMPPLPGTAPVGPTDDGKQDSEDSAPEATTTSETRTVIQTEETQNLSITAKPQSVDSDLPMNLEDFQVPKPRYNDLDSFYSDEESEEEAGDDDDVVISSASARFGNAASSKYHKQQFLDSDDSESDTEQRPPQRKAPPPSPTQRSPRRHMTKPSTGDQSPSEDVSVSPVAVVVPSPPSTVRPLSSDVVSPRVPASPPRPSTSPQHSPRRRVKESEAPVPTKPAERPVSAQVSEQTEQDVTVTAAIASVPVNLSAEVKVEDRVGVDDMPGTASIAPKDEPVDLPSPIQVTEQLKEDTTTTVVTEVNPVEIPDPVQVMEDTEGNVVSTAATEVIEDISVYTPNPVAVNMQADIDMIVPTPNTTATIVTEDDSIDSPTPVQEEEQGEGEATMTTTTMTPTATITTENIKTEVQSFVDGNGQVQNEDARKESRSMNIQGSEPSVDLPTIPSPPLAPMVSNEPGNLGDILEAFLNDSDSELEGSAFKTVTLPVTTKAVEDSDEDDDAGNDRFAAYDKRRSTQRRSKPGRRKQFSDMTATNESPIASFASSTQTSKTPSFANEDVLAAIRKAEQDALRMFEASTPSIPATAASSDHGVEAKPKKKSSSRKKVDVTTDDDGSRKKSMKKNRVKRHEILLTDEDE